jgi:hypothetical protein
MEDLIEIPQHSVIQYVRNKKNIPLGVLVAIKTPEGFRIGYSLCNKKDRFNKNMALKIAIGRAGFGFELGSHHVRGESYPTCFDDGGYAPHPVRKMIPAFYDRCMKYYKV